MSQTKSVSKRGVGTLWMGWAGRKELRSNAGMDEGRGREGRESKRASRGMAHSDRRRERGGGGERRESEAKKDIHVDVPDWASASGLSATRMSASLERVYSSTCGTFTIL